jgi:hypothetical protein
MENKINSSSIISLTLVTLVSFVIFFTFFSERPEIAVASIQNNQSTNQIVTQEQGDNKKIVQQGVVTSSPDPLPGHEAHQSVTILRLKGDNTIYEGTLSFIASKPVEVQIIYRNMTSASNSQSPQISTQFGTMNIVPLPGGQGSVVSSLILPQYPEEATSFSASIPFAGNGLALHNLAGDEFVATYTVVADEVGPAERADEIVNPPAEEEGEEEGNADEENNDEDNDNE